MAEMVITVIEFAFCLDNGVLNVIMKIDRICSIQGSAIENEDSVDYKTNISGL